MNEQNKKVPTVRFKGFTNDWEQQKLGDFGSVAMNKRIFKKQTTEVGDVPFYKIGTFGKKPDAYISNELFEEYKSKYPYPKEGDLLISASGSIGRIVEYKGQKAYYQDSNIVWLKHNDQLNNLFLKAFYQIVKWDGTEGSTIKRLYNKNILRTRIFLPTTLEQEKVGNIIECIERLLALQQRKFDLLKQLKKGLLQKMFADKDSKRPVLRFKGFHDDWEQRKVSDIFTVTRGQVLATTKISEVKTNEMCFPVYSSQTKNNGLMGYYNKYLFNTAITWTTDGANAGTVNYREGKFYSTNVNGVLLSDDGYANKAIAEILDRVAWRHVSRVGNPKLMNNVMSNIKISIPSSFEEQNAISEFLIKFDHLIVLHQRKQNHLKLLKKSLLQQMFM